MYSALFYQGPIGNGAHALEKAKPREFQAGKEGKEFEGQGH